MAPRRCAIRALPYIMLTLLRYCSGSDIYAQSDPDQRRQLRALQEKAPILTERDSVFHEMPMFFAINQGTTGTRSMFRAICYMNLTAVHYENLCLEARTPRALSNHTIVGLQAHFQAVKLSQELATCVNRVGSCRLSNAMRMLQEMKTYMKEVIYSEAIQFVSDTPYEQFTSFVLQTLRQAGRPPLLIMTQRDPLDWAIRRVEGHDRVVFCRAYFDMTQEELEAFEAENPNFDPFDFDQCTHLALRRREGRPKYASDVFFTAGRMVQECSEKNPMKGAQPQDCIDQRMDRLALTFDIYQKKYSHRDYVIYDINLFEQENHLTNYELAKDVHRHIMAPELTAEMERSKLVDSGMILREQTNVIDIHNQFMTEILAMRIHPTENESDEQLQKNN